ncbi:MAG: TfoX/Sxy family protein [Thermodesulfobacteriota bacterium]
MPRADTFISYLLEMLEDLGAVRVKRMFGGYGIYSDDIFFAIVVDNILYIKADDLNRQLFEAKGLPRFTYKRKGRDCTMSYYMAPEEALEDKDELYLWATKGYEAALRGKKKA